MTIYVVYVCTISLADIGYDAGTFYTLLATTYILLLFVFYLIAFTGYESTTYADYINYYGFEFKLLLTGIINPFSNYWEHVQYSISYFIDIDYYFSNYDRILYI